MLKKYLARLTRKDQAVNKVDVLFIILGLAFFAMISLATISDSSIWFDEAFSAYLIQFSFAEIWHYTSLDVHPPLYYYLLKIWSWLFGTTELGLRSMSVFFGAIAIVFAYLITHKYFGRRAAVYALIVLAIAPMVVRYSQEMRMYTMVASIALVATYVLIHAIESGRRKLWILYGVLLALGMWTHYFAAIVWLAHWAWRALIVGAKHKTPLAFIRQFFTADWIIAHVLAVGLFVPWIPFLLAQMDNVQTNGFWIPAVGPPTIVNFFTNTFLYLDQWQVVSWMAVLFFAVIALLIWLGVRGYKALPTDQKRGYQLLLCLAFVPPGLLVLASLPPLQPAFTDRYLVPSAVAVGMLVAVTLSFGRQAVRSVFARCVVLVLILSSLVIGTINVYHYGNYNKTTEMSSGAKQLIASIKAKSQAGQPIIADSPWVFYDATFYSTREHPVFFIDEKTDYRYGSLEMLRTQDRNKIKDLAQFEKEHPALWYIGRPGEGELVPPDETWVPQQVLRQADPTTGKPAYVAIQYRINAE